MTLLWKPLLAATLPADCDLERLSYPLLASPKIDGVRAMVQDKTVVTRNGSPVPNKGVQERYGRREYEGLDGELTVGPANSPDVFSRTVKVVSSAAPEKCVVEVSFNVIDIMMDNRLSLMDRCKTLTKVVKDYDVLLIGQTIIRSAAELRKYEDKTLARGYEGVMLRKSWQGPYPQKPGKDNRSTLNEFYLVKLKRFDYGEAVILASHPLEHNLNEERTAGGRRSTKKGGVVIDINQVGSVTVKDCSSGVEFALTVSTGELRGKGMDWWRRRYGARIRYKHFPIGVVSAPRFPTATFEELL
jgi:DNA ligase-1